MSEDEPKEPSSTEAEPAFKGRSPFYPGQPVPVELFAGRSQQLHRIIERGVNQVALGKPVAMYVQGEYGIGKSSIAAFCQWVGERQYGLHPIYSTVGAAGGMNDVAASVLEATIRSGGLDSNRGQRIRNMLAKYIGEQTLFGVTLHA